MTKFFDHPEYTSSIEDFQLLYDLDKANQTVLRSKKYLIPYYLEEASTEGKEAFDQRAKRTYFTPYFSCLKELTLSYLFKVEPDLTEFVGENKLFTEQEASNIDGKKTSLLDFIKRIASDSILYPKSYVYVNAPDVKGVISQTQQEKLGLRPYGGIWCPLEIQDWGESEEFSKFGELVFIHRQYQRLAKRSGPSDQPKLELIREELLLKENKLIASTYRKKQSTGIKMNYGVDNVYRIEGGDEWEVVSRTTINWLDKIPVIVSNGESWLMKCAHECLRLHNLISSYENILYYQGYKRTVIAGKPLDKTEKVPGSENTVFWIEKDGKVFDIGSENPEGIKARVEEVRNTIFRLGLNQLRQLDASSKSVQASDTIREEKQDSYTKVKSKVNEIEDTVNNFFALWAQFKNQKPPTAKFKIIDKFSGKDLSDFLETYQATLDAQGELTELRKEMLRQLTELIEPSPEAKKKIEQEIEAYKGREDLNQDSTLSRTDFLNGYNENPNDNSGSTNI